MKYLLLYNVDELGKNIFLKSQKFWLSKFFNFEKLAILHQGISL